MRKDAVAFEETGVRVWTTDESGYFIREYTDQIPGPEGRSGGVAMGRGAACAAISLECMAMLERMGVPTHIQDRFSDTELVVQKITIMPIKVRCRNAAAGALAARLGVPEAQSLPVPIIEFFLNNEALNNPRYNYEHVSVSGNVSEGEVKVVQARGNEINALLKDFLIRRGIVLADCALEFGRDSNSEIRLGGDITPDTCRMWDREAHEKLDSNVFRRDLRGDELAYRTVMRRICGDPA